MSNRITFHFKKGRKPRNLQEKIEKFARKAVKRALQEQMDLTKFSGGSRMSDEEFVKYMDRLGPPHNQNAAVQAARKRIEDKKPKPIGGPEYMKATGQSPQDYCRKRGLTGRRYQQCVAKARGGKMTFDGPDPDDQRHPIGGPEYMKATGQSPQDYCRKKGLTGRRLQQCVAKARGGKMSFTGPDPDDQRHPIGGPEYMKATGQDPWDYCAEKHPPGTHDHGRCVAKARGMNYIPTGPEKTMSMPGPDPDPNAPNMSIDPNPPAPGPGPKKKRKSSCSYAKASQMRLIRKGAVPDLKTIQDALGIKADGRYGPKTCAAIRQHQKEEGLTPDGVVGPKTWATLKFDMDDFKKGVSSAIDSTGINKPFTPSQRAAMGLGREKSTGRDYAGDSNEMVDDILRNARGRSKQP